MFTLNKTQIGSRLVSQELQIQMHTIPKTMFNKTQSFKIITQCYQILVIMIKNHSKLYMKVIKYKRDSTLSSIKTLEVKGDKI